MSWQADYIKQRIWVVPFLYGAMLFSAGMFWIISGRPFDRKSYERVIGQSLVDWKNSTSLSTRDLLSAVIKEMGGNSAWVAGLCIMMISFNSFRRREIWSWFLVSLLPIHSLIDLIILIKYKALSTLSLSWDLGLITICTLALIFSYKDFFQESVPTGDKDDGKTLSVKKQKTK